MMTGGIDRAGEFNKQCRFRIILLCRCDFFNINYYNHLAGRR